MGTKVNSNYESLLTFTRASKGHALRPVSYGDELVTNGDFSSTDLSDWDSYRGGDLSVESGVLVVEGTGASFAGVTHNVSTKVNKVYKISLEIASYGTGTGNPRLESPVTSSYVTSTSLTAFEFVFVATSTTTVIRVASGSSGGGNSKFKVDNVTLKEVLFDQPDGTLTLFEHPDDVPRVEWDAQRNRLGLLVEEQRTNLILNSSDFSVSSWTKSGSSISAATNITAPDGTTNSFKLTEDSSANAHRVQGAQAAGGTTSTMSCFMKKAERSWGNINFAGLSNGQAWFDLENGVLGTVQSAVTAKIEDYGNGWYRCSVTATPTSASTTDIKVANADDSIFYSGDGASGIYVFGAQTEAGSFPTSYMKTSGNTASRSADVASIPVADFGFNKKASNILVDVKNIGDQTSSAVYLYDIAGNSGSNRIAAYITSSDGITFYTNDGGTSAAYGVGTATFDEMKLSVSFKDGSASSSLNGASVVTSTSVNYPKVSPTDFYIGSRFSSLEQLNAHIKSIQYYPRRLTNAQLEALTEPRSTPTLSLTFDGLESSYTENYIHG